MGILYTLPFLGQNKITSAYGIRILNGKRDNHPGWDIVGVDHKEVEASCPGTVKSSTIITDKSNLTWQWGNYVKIRNAIKHDQFSCHMKSRAVSVGLVVNTGDKLGIMGNTGYSFGEHTHWEAREANGMTICPGELFGLPNMAGITWDREKIDEASVGTLECTKASYRWRKGPGTSYNLYQPANIERCMYCHKGVIYRVYASERDSTGQVWYQITPPKSCATVGIPSILWVSGECGVYSAKQVPEKPEPPITENPKVDWDSPCNEFVVSVTGADRVCLRQLCDELGLTVKNLQ